MKVTQERYNYLIKVLDNSELEGFEVVETKTVEFYGVVGTMALDGITDYDRGNEDHYIYDAIDEGYYVVPLTFDSLEAAKSFINKAL